MAYLGNQAALVYTTTTKDTFSGDGTTVAFTLSRAANATNARVVVSNVIQDPNVAYTVSGTTLTFTSAPPVGTDNVYVVHLGPPAATVVPPEGTVGGVFKGERGRVGQSTAAGDIFRINEQQLDTDVTIDANENAGCVGPLTVASGVTLTVTTGGNLVIA